MDVVVETVGGKSDALTEAVSVVARGGTIAMLGVFEGSPRIPGLPFADRELTLVGSYCYARDARVGDFAYATELLSKYRSQLPELVTHRFKLDEVSRAFEAASRQEVRLDQGSDRTLIGVSVRDIAYLLAAAPINHAVERPYRSTQLFGGNSLETGFGRM